MSSDDTIHSIEKLIEDETFQDLNRDLSETTLFDVLGISLKESTHSRMLGWLLDPSESHGLGDTILRRFLYEASKLARSQRIDFDGNGSAITPLQAETFSFSDLIIQSEISLSPERRLDLFLSSEHEGWLCVIENKILSEEGEEQTTDYYSEMLRSFPVVDNSRRPKFPNRLFVYLTPKGDEPKSRHFIRMSYSIMEILIRKYSGSASGFGRIVTTQYVQCLTRRVMEQEHLEDICYKLYRSHQRAIDKIVEYGKVNRLLMKMTDCVLEELQSGQEPVFPRQQIEWTTANVPRGGVWTGIRAAHWPGAGLGWPAFYRFLRQDQDGTAEKVKFTIEFAGPGGPRVRELFLEIAPSIGLAMLEPIYSELKDLGDLKRIVETQSAVIVARVKASYDPLDEAIRRWKAENPKA